MHYLAGLLGAVTCLLALNFYDWPPDRDVTTYAVIARELLAGQALYVDVWDLKPPGVFVAYLAAQSLVAAGPLQILLLDLVPTLVVLAALIASCRRAGFGDAAAIWSGLFWVAASGDVPLRLHEPNTEIFIDAFVTLAFWQFLGRSRPWSRPITIGLLFAAACLFKTVAIAMAVVIGLAHVAFPPSGSRRWEAAGQVAVMAASGAIGVAAVFCYFAATGRFQVFYEVMVLAGAAYAGDVGQNVLAALTLAPLLGDRPLLQAAAATLPWLAVGLLARFDRERRRSWALLGAYGFSALVAVGLPGNFYRHYYQLLVPPLCLGLGWLAALPAGRPRAIRTFATGALLGLTLLLLCIREAGFHRVTADLLLRGTYQELYLETRDLGRRLGAALSDDELLYQWGEESGLYWYSGRRPPASVLRWPLVAGPQAARLTEQTLDALTGRPPDLIVAVKRVLASSEGHPVFTWIEANYAALEPEDPEERRFFTFFVPADASPQTVRRILGGHPAVPAPAAGAAGAGRTGPP